MTEPVSVLLKEAARLLGAQDAHAEFFSDLKTSYELLLTVSKPRSVYKTVLVKQTRKGILFDNSFEIESFDLKKLFANSNSAVILAVTLGAEVDALIRRKMACDMHCATLLDACASAETERVCDSLEQKIFAKLDNGSFLTRRFSPGYGDVDVKYSSILVNCLNTQKLIGLSVTSQAMLVPIKSVTALLGISCKKENRFRRCEECMANKNCIYKRRGECCGI